jgi:hypothetical protein
LYGTLRLISLAGWGASERNKRYAPSTKKPPSEK